MFGTLVLAGCAVCCQVESPTAEDLSVQVRRLVRQLDALEKESREQAEQQLLELGPPAIELLPRVNNRMSAEVKQRLARVRNRLERQQAESSVKASLITFSAENTPVSEILAAISQQSGNRIEDYRGRFNQDTSDPEITVSFDKTPFWQALDEVLDAASLQLYPYGEDGIALQARNAVSASRTANASYTDAFRFEGIELIAQRNLRGDVGNQLQLIFEATWEPRLKPMVISHPLSGVTAVDEDLNPIAVDGADQEPEFEIQPGMTNIEVPITFSLPPRSSKKIVSVEGALLALIPGRTETFVFDEIEGARQIEQNKAGVTVVLDRVRRNNDVWEVRVLVRFDEASRALESHRGWVINNDAFLVSPDNEQILEETREVTLETDSEIGMAFLFDLPEGPAGYRLVYKTPVAILDLPVRYELKNLQLP